MQKAKCAVTANIDFDGSLQISLSRKRKQSLAGKFQCNGRPGNRQTIRNGVSRQESNASAQLTRQGFCRLQGRESACQISVDYIYDNFFV